jgi:hypothetical protein
MITINDSTYQIVRRDDQPAYVDDGNALLAFNINNIRETVHIHLCDLPF